MLSSVSYSESGIGHILAIAVVVIVAIAGTGLMVASHAMTPYDPPGVNPYTSSCSGNRVAYGSPKGRTNTQSARESVFGKADTQSNMVRVSFRGHSTDGNNQPLLVNKKVAPCLKAVDWDLDHIYHTKYKVHTLWTYAPINGTNNTVKRFHSYGGAIDINPATNGYYLNGCSGSGCVTDMPRTWVKAFRAHGFFWGGNYPHVKDYMHFEWHGQR